MRLGKGEIFILLSAVGFGIMPIFAKFAYNAGAGVNQVLFYRFLFASVLMWSYLLLTKKDYRIEKRNIAFIAVMGVLGFNTTAIAAFISFKYISAGLANLLLFLYPPIIAVVQRVFFKVRISKMSYGALLLAITGIVFIVWTPDMNYNIKGITAGVLSAVFYTFYVMSLGSERIRNVDGLVITTYVVTSCTFGMLVYSILLGDFVFSINLSSTLYIFLISTLSTVLSIFLFCLGVKEIGPSRASIIGTFEPVVATFAGALFFREVISLFTAFGGGLIIAGVILLQIDKKKRMEHSNMVNM